MKTQGEFAAEREMIIEDLEYQWPGLGTAVERGQLDLIYEGEDRWELYQDEHSPRLLAVIEGGEIVDFGIPETC